MRELEVRIVSNGVPVKIIRRYSAGRDIIVQAMERKVDLAAVKNADKEKWEIVFMDVFSRIAEARVAFMGIACGVIYEEGNPVSGED